MKINKLTYVFVFIFLLGCGNLVFVYEQPDSSNNIKKLTELKVYGDESEEILSHAIKKIGLPSGNPFYSLSINSSKKVVASLIEKDATASKFNVSFNISYNLQNIEDGCLIYKETISTETSYDSKSEGYSFGSDFAEKESARENIRINFNKFLNNLAILLNDLSCKNEN